MKGCIVAFPTTGGALERWSMDFVCSFQILVYTILGSARACLMILETYSVQVLMTSPPIAVRKRCNQIPQLAS